ncbi:Predicted TonB-dependent receptor [uncultured Desulfatiglans sp.]|nr:Predicted TonB-dependent receptor [uncultured Desulfatiglans sp.]
MKVKHAVEVLLLSFFLVFSLSMPGAQAQDKKAASQPGVFDLGEVVVTGEAETVTQITTVDTIDRQELDLTNAQSVSEAIETLPGVFVSTGTRNEAYVNVRGFNQRYVPIYIDGIPLYLPWDGYVDASELSTGNISQITLTKGAASTLYGPNTMGGVINMVSMKPSKPFEGSYSFEVDENGPSGSLNLGSRIDNAYVMAGISGLDYDDFKMSDDFTPIRVPPGFRGYYEDGKRRDNSDMESIAGSFKVGFMPAEGHEYAIGVQHTNSERGLPVNVQPTERQRFWRFTEWEKTTYYFIGDSKITDHLTANTRLYYDTYYNVLDSYDSPSYDSQNMKYAFHSTYDDYTPGGSFTLRTTYIPRNKLSFAFHYKKDVHEEQDDIDTLWERYEAETYSYGLEDAIALADRLDLVLGVSYDVQKTKYANGGPLRDDDDVFNTMGGLVYTLEDATKFHGSVASKSRFPTLKELYSSLLGTATPNPNLEKEESVNYEIGVERPLPWKSSASLALFYADVDNLIVQTTLQGNDFYDNIGKARHQGLELGFKSEFLPNNTLEAHYTYLDAENRSPDRVSDHLPESPEHQIYLSDLYQANEWLSFFTKIQYNAGQWEEKSNNEWTELGSYWLFDLKAMAEISKFLVAEVGVRNLFDENYETGYGFPREGRTFFCGLRGTF